MSKSTKKPQKSQTEIELNAMAKVAKKLGLDPSFAPILLQHYKTHNK